MFTDGGDACSSASCAQLCLLKPSNGYVCSCKDGFSVGNDRTNCVSKLRIFTRGRGGDDP